MIQPWDMDGKVLTSQEDINLIKKVIDLLPEVPIDEVGDEDRSGMSILLGAIREQFSMFYEAESVDALLGKMYNYSIRQTASILRF